MFSTPNRVIAAFIACAILFAVVLISILDAPPKTGISRVYTPQIKAAALDNSAPYLPNNA